MIVDAAGEPHVWAVPCARYDKRFSLPAIDVPAVLSAAGKSGVDEADHAGRRPERRSCRRRALQPASAARRARRRRPPGLCGQRARQRGDCSATCSAGNVPVARFRLTGSVAEGQFAYRPDRQQIMAQITRRTPGFVGHYTVHDSQRHRRGRHRRSSSPSGWRRSTSTSPRRPTPTRSTTSRRRSSPAPRPSGLARGHPCYTRPRRCPRGAKSLPPTTVVVIDRQGHIGKGPAVARDSPARQARDLASDIARLAAAKKAQRHRRPRHG